MGTRRAYTNPCLGSGRKAAGPMLEYVRYSRSSTRFSKMSESPSLPRISKIPSTGSRQPRSISRSAALRSGQLARNWSSTVLPFGRRYKSANRSMASIASSSISTSWGPALSSMNRSRCRSIRGLSAKPTKARFSSALRSMSEASDRSSPPWFMARGATSLLRPARRVTARPATPCRTPAARRVRPAPGSRHVLLGPYCPPLRFRPGTAESRYELGAPPFRRGQGAGASWTAIRRELHAPAACMAREPNPILSATETRGGRMLHTRLSITYRGGLPQARGPWCLGASCCACCQLEPHRHS